MTRKQKHLLTRILVAAVLFLAGSLLHLPEYVEMGVFLVCYAVVGWDIVWKAITNILHGQVFDENFLMTIATIGALILGEHSEGVAVMLFYQVLCLLIEMLQIFAAAFIDHKLPLLLHCQKQLQIT